MVAINAKPTYYFLLGCRSWSENFSDDVVRWCEESLVGQFRIWPGNNREQWVEVTLEEVRDAVLFRLWWANDINVISNKKREIIYDDSTNHSFLKLRL